MLLAGNLRQVRLDLSKFLLVGRYLIHLFEIGFMLSHQFLKVHDPALVPSLGILEVAHTLARLALLGHGLL